MAKLDNAGVVTVSAGTAVRFTPAPTPIKSILVHANKANTGDVYVGDSTTSSTTTVPLEPGEKLEIEFRESVEETSGDLADFYVDSAVSGEGITYLAIDLS
jgi:hypothetical protein